MKPSPEFNILVYQILFRNRIIKIKSSSHVYAVEDIEIEPIINLVKDFCFNTENARLLVNQLPKEASFHYSWMKFLDVTTHSCIIDDTVSVKNGKIGDVIYIDIHEQEEAFVLSKAILLWKLRDMINKKEIYNIEDYFVEQTQNA